MTTTVPSRFEGLPRAQAQRRVLTVLVTAQVLSGAGLAAGVTVGALLTRDMLHSTGLAGLAGVLITGGSALAAAVVGRVCQARGRRPGLAAGYLVGAVGSAGVVVAAVVGSPVLLLLGMFVYGAGTATNLLARYAGADLATPAHRARAVSTVLVATTLGGVVGPNLTAPTGDLARALGIPYLAGPFLLAGAAYAMAGVLLAGWLRPDPLLLARTLPAATEDAPTGNADGRPEVARRRSSVLVGALVMVLTQLVMVAIMTMTPVHMHAHGHSTAASGLVIAMHVGAMYLPSPLTGWLVDRVGRRVMAVVSGLTLLAAGVLAASAPGDPVLPLAAALALLGLGWNFGLVSGTAVITDALPPATRARTQGIVDVAVAIAGASGGMASSLVVASAGFPALALAGGLVSLVLLPALVAARAR